MRAEAIAVGTSLGGLNALLTVLGGLPPGLNAPVLVVQHRGADADAGLVNLLSDHTKLIVVEAEDKAIMAAGTVYIAPADYHLLVEVKGELALSTEAPVRLARPSIDVLFETAATAYGPSLLAVLLTGASADGAEGLSRVKTAGGRAIVQDPATAECATMPLAALAATAVDYVLPLEAIAAHMVSLVDGTRA